jgi:hypothetical protein
LPMRLGTPRHLRPLSRIPISNSQSEVLRSAPGAMEMAQERGAVVHHVIVGPEALDHLGQVQINVMLAIAAVDGERVIGRDVRGKCGNDDGHSSNEMP